MFSMVVCGRGFWTAKLSAAHSSEPFSITETNTSFRSLPPIQTLCFDFHGVNLVVAVTAMQSLDFNSLKGSLSDGQPASSAHQSVPRGILISQTQVQFTKAADSTIKLKGSAKGGPTTAIIQPDFKFEDLGIGGLDKEFSAIFRRAFASRIFPASLVEKLGIQHVKGILLYGEIIIFARVFRSFLMFFDPPFFFDRPSRNR